MLDKFAYWTAWVSWVVIVPMINTLLQLVIYNWLFGTNPPTPISIYKFWPLLLANVAGVCHLSWLYYELQIGEEWEELNG